MLVLLVALVPCTLKCISTSAQLLGEDLRDREQLESYCVVGDTHPRRPDGSGTVEDYRQPPKHLHQVKVAHDVRVRHRSVG